MMLPFLKNRRVAGTVMEYRKPDGASEKAPEDEQDQSLISCAEAAIRAINAKDAEALAKAFQDAFDVMESQPHDEAAEVEPSGDEG